MFEQFTASRTPRRLAAASPLWSSGGGRSARWALVCLVLTVTTAAASVLPILPVGSSAVALTADEGYEPCKDKESVDLVLMMDGSGSLNGPDGVDPGGTQRMTALQGIRDILSGRTRVRIALYSFDEEARRHADFGVASDRHPSDAAIEESKGGERYTDYGAALDAALEAFGRAQEGSCRVMVWFTDGLHDPEPGYGPDELDKAKAWRDQACDVTSDSTKRAFEKAGIQTFAVLLGDSFKEGLSAPNDARRTMAEISMDVIRGFTGHATHPSVVDVPTVPECDWGNYQAGEILTVEGVEDLASGLLKSLLKTTHFQWRDCERLRDGSRVNSNDLPAGEFIEEIVVLAFGGDIERYGLLQAASAAPTSTDWQPLPDGSRQLRLESQHMQGLPAGWGLVLEVQPDDGKDPSSVTLECYSKKVPEPLAMHGTIVDEQGDRPPVVPAESTHTLRVDMHPYECPVDSADFVLMLADSDPPLNSSEPVRGGGCEQGPIVDFEFYSGRLDQKTRVTAFAGDLKPPFAANLWGRDSKLEARVATDFEILPYKPPPPPGVPELECKSEPRLDGDWLNGEFRGRSETDCYVYKPDDDSDAEGTGTVSVDEPSGDGAFHIETPDGPVDGDLPVAAGDLPLKFWVVSDDPGVNEAAVILVWGGQSQREPPAPLPPPPFVCDDKEPRLHGEWRDNEYSGRIVAAKCTVHRPAGSATGSAGSIEVETLRVGVRYYIETRGTLLEGSLELVFDDLPRDFSVVSGPIASQGPWELGGEVDITLEPPPGNPRARERVTIPNLDPLDSYPEWPRLECDDPIPALEPTNAGGGEVPEEPVVVEAPCEAIGPGMGELRLSLPAWTPDPPDEGEAGLPASLDWRIVDSPGLDGSGRTLTLQPKEVLQPLVLASTAPLPNDWIKGTGTVTVKAVWLLPWQERRNIATHNLPVKIDLIPRPNPWLAALLVLIGAALTYALLYAIMARSIRLPPAGSFFGTRLEFKIERRPTGFCSRQLEGFETDSTAWSKVSGDRRHLRLSDLRIDAERPSWWQISSILGLLNGGWGKPSRDAGAAVFDARPAGSPSRPGTTPANFNELAVVALGTGVSDSSDEPEGIAYLLVPKKASERRLDSGDLSNLLRGMTPRYDAQAAASAGPPKGRPAGPAPDGGPGMPPPAPGGPAKPPPLPPKAPPAPGGSAKPPPLPPKRPPTPPPQ